MRRLLVLQVLILFIGALVYTPALSVERADKDQGTIGIQKCESCKPDPDDAKKKDVDPNVYITKTGKKYHKKGCSFLSKSKIKIRLSEAKRRGYKPCSKCKPPK